ncbi:hypothetical protein HY214_01945 [Candidatus Roizmanbacteria bacterium]|nr:hypothetical protein [Candidatus Roizmanbacteria bacterium]
MKNWILPLTLFFVTASYCLAAIVSPVLAQQVSLSISPPLLQLVMKPGASILIAYRVENKGDPVILNSYLRNFESSDSLGKISIKNNLEGPIRFSLENSNLKLEEPFFLKTNDSTQLLLRIRAPEGAPEGDYYHTLLVESQPSANYEGSVFSQAKATIGSNILITVSTDGQVEAKGKIIGFSVLGGIRLPFFKLPVQFFDSFDKIPVLLRLENNGRNLITPTGNISLIGSFGEKAVYDIQSEDVLSQSSRVLHATPSAQLANPPLASVILSGFFIGKYKLVSQVSLGEGVPNLYAADSFIALPIRIAVGLLSVFGVIVLIIKRLKNISGL